MAALDSLFKTEKLKKIGDVKLKLIRLLSDKSKQHNLTQPQLQLVYKKYISILIYEQTISGKDAEFNPFLKKPAQPYVTKKQLQDIMFNFAMLFEDRIASENDIRTEFDNETFRKLCKEEYQKLQSSSSLEEEIAFSNVLIELKEKISKSDLPNPQMYFKEIDSQKIINVVIDSSKEYGYHLKKFGGLLMNIYQKYNLDLEIFLFQQNEIKVPFHKQGFKEY